jgi:iron uptake system component EfeO
MLFALLVACHYDNDATDPEKDATDAVKTYINAELTGLADSALALKESAPAPDADGWGTGETAEMETAWSDARDHYERVEGAIAVLFPDLDVSTDQRYDFFVAAGPDDDLFDDQIVTGDHAIERIVWADRIPASVVTFEASLPFYAPAAFPATESQATEFHDLLCQRFLDETASMASQFEPLTLDDAAAFRGVISSMAEQYEKVDLAASGEDESRYAARTLGDMRANLEGGRAIYLAFQPWLDQEDGSDLDADILAGFDRIDAAYAAIQGDAIPAVPEGWNPDAPSSDDLATPYGELWTALSTDADPTVDGSLVERMTAAADLLGIPEL